MQAFKGLKAKAKDHPQGQGLRSQGQGLEVPRTWILALRTKAKD